jgi:hypothetical protein
VKLEARGYTQASQNIDLTSRDLDNSTAGFNLLESVLEAAGQGRISWSVLGELHATVLFVPIDVRVDFPLSIAPEKNSTVIQ